VFTASIYPPVLFCALSLLLPLILCMFWSLLSFFVINSVCHLFFYLYFFACYIYICCPIYLAVIATWYKCCMVDHGPLWTHVSMHHIEMQKRSCGNAKKVHLTWGSRTDRTCTSLLKWLHHLIFGLMCCGCVWGVWHFISTGCMYCGWVKIMVTLFFLP
jgi:hypothetical protein